MHILVTGGAGYIGSHICKSLAHKGYIPVTLDDLSQGHRGAVCWGPFVQGDIANWELLNSLCKEYQFQGAIHLAAHSNVRESHQIPLIYFLNNVGGSLTLLKALKMYKVPFFVLSSTCSVYGMPRYIPIDEDHLKCPVNNYGKSKWMVEQILQSLEGADTTIAILRYFNAAGADIDGELGEDHNPETHLIPLLIQTALKRAPYFTLFGDAHDTPDGTPIRDFIHVTDLAEAHIQALEWMIQTGENVTCNLGIGKGYSVKEVIEAVEERWGHKISVKKEGPFLADPPVLIANPEKAQKILKWHPQYSDLSTIIDTAWRWHKNR